MNESQISQQHPIPQNFMDVEFKIVGEFTVRQFTYMCATGLPMYILYSSPIQSFVKTILLIILGLFGILLVFVPIDDRSMDVWIVNFFKSVYSNNRRVWRKTPIIPKTLSMEAIKLVQGEMITLAPTSSRRKLEEYLKGIKEEAPDEYDFDFKKFQYYEVTAVSPVRISIQPKIEPILKEPTTPSFVPEQPPASVTEVVKPVEEQKPAIQEVVLKLPEVTKPVAELAKDTSSQELIKKIIQPIKFVPTALKEAIKPKPKPVEKLDVHEEMRTSSTEVPGRKFVSFSKREQDIVLPIRGEKTIQLSNTPTTVSPATVNKDIRTLTKELRTLVREIKQEEPAIQPTTATSNEIISNNNLIGICFDQSNNPLVNLMLALLDSNEKELQYTRTDNLGKFTFKNTPTGDFKIKVLNPEIYSLNFDIISISVKEYPYSFIQIIGKK